MYIEVTHAQFQQFAKYSTSIMYYSLFGVCFACFGSKCLILVIADKTYVGPTCILKTTHLICFKLIYLDSKGIDGACS